MKVTITTRIQLSSRVHLTWTFYLLPHGDIKDVISPLARTGLFYYSCTKSLIGVINEKDIHIQALQEKLQDSGGSYFPRKHKDALESFDEDKWRDGGRKESMEGRESGLEVFERWEEADPKDWEACVAGLGNWNRDTEEKSDRVSLITSVI